ncbi:hypothetical protein HZA33_03595 [Candidatus Pacearchaeota archaeon]|nr:hypothetical protein [Candidatus Pacearchaeota archaeon]
MVNLIKDAQRMKETTIPESYDELFPDRFKFNFVTAKQRMDEVTIPISFRDLLKEQGLHIPHDTTYRQNYTGV